jgi:predicted PhzF superfamily epimerase YddE/YHI9
MLAAAHVLWNDLKPDGIDAETMYFDTPFGIFMISNDSGRISVHTIAKNAEPAAAPDRLINALGMPPIAVSKCGQIYIVEMFNSKHVIKLEPDIAKMQKIPCNGIVVTAEGGKDVEYDFMSRFFAPSEGFNEDPVTLWNHCFLATYWANRLNKTHFFAMQMSNRAGLLDVEYSQDQVKISGKCVTSASGILYGVENWSFSADLFDSMT